MHGIPIRLNIDFFTIRKVVVEMTDLFAGVKARAPSEEEVAAAAPAAGAAAAASTSAEFFHDDSMRGVARVGSLDFAPFEDVSLYDFLYTFATRVIKIAALDYKAIYTGTPRSTLWWAEIASGCGKCGCCDACTSLLQARAKSSEASRATSPIPPRLRSARPPTGWAVSYT